MIPPPILVHGDVCSGIGGFSLAAEMVGCRTVVHCEIEPYCQRVLKKHWPEVPIVPDIRELTAGLMAGLGIGRLDILTGGVPCQPRSQAGKRRGKEDHRDLWPEMRRVVAELRPHAVVVENPPGVLSMDIQDWVADLEREGYEVGVVVLPAAAIGAPHIRDRVFLLAHDTQHGRRTWGQGRPDPGNQREREPVWSFQDVADSRRVGDERRREPGDVAGASGAGEGETSERERLRHTVGHSRSAMANAGSVQCSEQHATPLQWGRSSEAEQAWLGRGGKHTHNAPDPDRKGLAVGVGSSGERWTRATIDRRDWWAVEPPVGRVAPKLSHRVDRLRGLGNAVVPQQAAAVLWPIAEWMRESLRDEVSA